jgi:hypothetical protein
MAALDTYSYVTWQATSGHEAQTWGPGLSPSPAGDNLANLKDAFRHVQICLSLHHLILFTLYSAELPLGRV